MRIKTQRLRLEPFVPAHREGLFALNSDPDVMRYLSNGVPDTLENTDASIAGQQKLWAKFGFGWWAVFAKDSTEIIGAACLQHLAHKEDNPLEIGWRLATKHHGHGYATEAGQAAADFAFGQIGVDYVKAVCNPENLASEAVMKRLGMTPLGIEIHYDEPCTTYRLDRPD